MATKRLTRIVYGADRKLWQDGDATLRVSRFDSAKIEPLWIRSDFLDWTSLSYIVAAK